MNHPSGSGGFSTRVGIDGSINSSRTPPARLRMERPNNANLNQYRIVVSVQLAVTKKRMERSSTVFAFVPSMGS